MKIEVSELAYTILNELPKDKNIKEWRIAVYESPEVCRIDTNSLTTTKGKEIIFQRNIHNEWELIL